MKDKEKKVKINFDKCQSCGGKLKFSPEIVNLKCDSCGVEVDFEKSYDVQKHDKESFITDLKQNKGSTSSTIKCENCGAMIKSGQYEVLSCTYCGSQLSVDNNAGKLPDGVVPFAFDSSEAIKRFKDGVKKKLFVESEFKKQLPHQKIDGVYVPAFAFDADSTTQYSGIIEELEHGESRSRRISGTIKCNHTNVLVKASLHMSDGDLSSIEPFDVDDAYKYDKNFIKGYKVENLQKDAVLCSSEARDKFKEEIESEIEDKHNENNIDNLKMNTTYTNEKYSYYLLPVYKFEYTYKKKTRRAYLNGQTGAVGGDLPTSALKIGLAIGIGLLALVGIGILFFKLARGF